jgi:osmotically-inducible protein OsmY
MQYFDTAMNILTGIVSTRYQKDRAVEISRSTEGIVKVINNLKVR